MLLQYICFVQIKMQKNETSDWWLIYKYKLMEHIYYSQINNEKPQSIIYCEIYDIAERMRVAYKWRSQS